MSQSGRLFDGTILPDIETLTGNSGGAVGPTGGNINIVGDGVTIDVVGNPGTSTLTISSLAQQYDTVTTADATPTILFSETLALNSAATVTSQIIAARSDWGAGLSATVTIGARRAAGGAILIGIPVVSINEDFGGGATLNATVSGNDIQIVVTGIAITTINWQSLSDTNTIV